MKSNSNAVFLCQRCKATAQLVRVDSGREMIRCPVCSHAEVSRKLYAAVEKAFAELVERQARDIMKGRKPPTKRVRKNFYGFSVEFQL